jgi:hypothetical protein
MSLFWMFLHDLFISEYTDLKQRNTLRRSAHPFHCLIVILLVISNFASVIDLMSTPPRKNPFTFQYIEAYKWGAPTCMKETHTAANRYGTPVCSRGASEELEVSIYGWSLRTTFSITAYHIFPIVAWKRFASESIGHLSSVTKGPREKAWSKERGSLHKRQRKRSSKQVVVV